MKDFEIAWQIITLGGFLVAGIYVVIDLLVEFIKDRNYKKYKERSQKDDKSK